MCSFPLKYYAMLYDLLYYTMFKVYVFCIVRCDSNIEYNTKYFLYSVLYYFSSSIQCRLCIYLYKTKHMHLSIYTYLNICVILHIIYIYIYIHTHICVSRNICMYIYMYIFMYVYMYMYMRMHLCTCICIYTYIRKYVCTKLRKCTNYFSNFSTIGYTSCFIS